MITTFDGDIKIILIFIYLSYVTVVGQVGEGELHLAAQQNDTETIERLISAGEDLNICDTVSTRFIFIFMLNIANNRVCIDDAVVVLILEKSEGSVLIRNSSTTLVAACVETLYKAVANILPLRYGH